MLWCMRLGGKGVGGGEKGKTNPTNLPFVLKRPAIVSATVHLFFRVWGRLVQSRAAEGERMKRKLRASSIHITLHAAGKQCK